MGDHTALLKHDKEIRSIRIVRREQYADAAIPGRRFNAHIAPLREPEDLLRAGCAGPRAEGLAVAAVPALAAVCVRTNGGKGTAGPGRMRAVWIDGAVCG